jgi:hemerythrin superfamily protein
MPATARQTVKTVKETIRGRSKTPASQDIIGMLKQDHKDVKGMFEQFDALGPRATEQRRKLGIKITDALKTHSKIEEQVLYPAFKTRAENHDELEQVLEAFEEHALADRLVEEIARLDARDESYEAKVKTLMDLVLHHVKEEEGQMFPTARELFEKDELANLGQQALRYKK